MGDFGFLSRLPSVSAQEAKGNPSRVKLNPEIEPLVRLVEDSPREKLLEEIAHKIRHGTTYQEVIAALFLAGVRGIQPRPVGFKFHAVLVVNAAHLASLASPDSERWLPIFWALDNFKESQARNKREGDWHMGDIDEAAVPSADKAKAAFVAAMDNWDEAATDVAVTGLARSAGADELFEIFSRYGARDFREIGHKAIYVVNSWRTLQTIGWHHAEPVLRSLAFALLDHEAGNPAKKDAPADRPGRRNREALKKIRADWLVGKPDQGATMELVKTLRAADADAACDKVIELLNRGVSVESVWSGYLQFGGELLMRNPGIISLHSLTSSNAFHYAFQKSGVDETRRFLLLQNAAFLTMFRGKPAEEGGLKIDELSPGTLQKTGAEALEEIFSEISRSKLGAARKVLAYARDDASVKEFADAARRLVFTKGRDAHDYKFSSAVLEDYRNLPPGIRERYLAASVFYLHSSNDRDNDLVRRTRAALA